MALRKSDRLRADAAGAAVTAVTAGELSEEGFFFTRARPIGAFPPTFTGSALSADRSLGMPSAAPDRPVSLNTLPRRVNVSLPGWCGAIVRPVGEMACVEVPFNFYTQRQAVFQQRLLYISDCLGHISRQIRSSCKKISPEASELSL